MSNIFENLGVDEEEIDHIKNEKKARKKIKAIHNLKKKENLTDEEQKKVDSEDDWQRILNPFYENMEKQKENKIREQQRLNKKKEQQQRESEQRQAESEQRQAESEQRQAESEQRQAESEQRQAEFKQRQREFTQRQRQKEFKQKQQYYKDEYEQRLEPKKMKTKNEKRIYIEFNLLIAKGDTIKKAKHNLLLKYHPDKNKEKSANEMTQIINNITIVKNKIL